MAAIALRVSTRPIAHTARRLDIPAYGATLVAELTMPSDAVGIVIHPRTGDPTANDALDFTMPALHQLGYATVIVDLLTADEKRLDGRTLLLSQDVSFLAKRLMGVATWLAAHHEVGGMPIGLFGTAHASGAALHVAARRPAWLRAVVAGDGLAHVETELLAWIIAPTLLLVRPSDTLDTERAHLAQSALRCPNDVVRIPDQVSEDHALASNESIRRTLRWVDRYLPMAKNVACPAASLRDGVELVAASAQRSSRTSSLGTFWSPGQMSGSQPATATKRRSRGRTPRVDLRET